MEVAKSRKKVSRGPKSCISCRRSKQRCDIPNRYAIQPSPHPQPAHLACHRCNVLKLHCIIEAPLQTAEEASDEGPSVGATPRKRSASPSASASTPSQRHSVDYRRHGSPFGYSHDRFVSSTSSASQEGRRDLHIFDPHFEDDRCQGSKEASTSHNPGYSNGCFQHPGSKVVDLAEILQTYHPFPYLFRLCSAQPDFLAPLSGRRAASLSFRQIIDKHSKSIHWEEMNLHLQEYQLFLPFLEPLRDEAHVGLYLATSLYLASLKTDLHALQVDLLLAIRNEAKACVSRGPRNTGEVAALVSLALYEPLLLVDSSEDMQLDGSGLLPAASGGAKVLDLEETPLLLRNFNLHSNGDPSDLLRRCSLWITIALYIGFDKLAGNATQRQGIECNREDLNAVEAFCKQSLEMAGAPHWSEQASLLLLVIFRYRTLRQFQGLIVRQVSILEGIPLSADERAEACMADGVERSVSFAHEVLNWLHILRSSLVLPTRTCDAVLDYIEYETTQFHMVCILNLTQACILRIADCYGRPISLHALIQRMMRDAKAMHFSSILAGPKRDLANRLAVQFSNFAARWSVNRNQPVMAARNSIDDGLTAVALPPTFCCAMMLLNIKCLADAVGGSFQRGNTPRNCLEDNEIANTSSLCRHYAEALRCFGSLQTEDVFLARGHRDMFRMTAGIAIRTSSALYEWAATAKGLRASIPLPGAESNSTDSARYSHQEQTPVRLADHPKSLSTNVNTQPATNADIQDFDRLLEDILSTPILYT